MPYTWLQSPLYMPVTCKRDDTGIKICNSQKACQNMLFPLSSSFYKPAILGELLTCNVWRQIEDTL